MKLLSLRLVKSEHKLALYDQYGRLLDQGVYLDWIGVLSTNVCRLVEVMNADANWASNIERFPDRYSEVVFSESNHS